MVVTSSSIDKAVLLVEVVRDNAGSVDDKVFEEAWVVLDALCLVRFRWLLFPLGPLSWPSNDRSAMR